MSNLRQLECPGAVGVDRSFGLNGPKSKTTRIFQGSPRTLSEFVETKALWERPPDTTLRRVVVASSKIGPGPVVDFEWSCCGNNHVRRRHRPELG